MILAGSQKRRNVKAIRADVVDVVAVVLLMQVDLVIVAPAMVAPE